MFKVKGFVVNSIEDLLPIFNENAEVTATALNILGKSYSKLNRKMKINSLTDFWLFVGLFWMGSLVGGQLKQQMDIQRQRIDILEGLIKDTQNDAINTKDKDEEM